MDKKSFSLGSVLEEALEMKEKIGGEVLLTFMGIDGIELPFLKFDDK